MAPDKREVKQENTWWSDLLEWADAHPRVGWWLMVMANLNLILNIIGVFH